MSGGKETIATERDRQREREREGKEEDGREGEREGEKRDSRRGRQEAKKRESAGFGRMCFSNHPSPPTTSARPDGSTDRQTDRQRNRLTDGQTNRHGFSLGLHSGSRPALAVALAPARYLR